MKKYTGKIIAVAIVMALMIVIISIIAVLGGAVMKMFGFEYDSIWNIIIFFVIMALLSFPAGLVTEAVPKVLYKEFQKLTAGQSKALYWFLIH